MKQTARSKQQEEDEEINDKDANQEDEEESHSVFCRHPEAALMVGRY